jgi:hypothetical protein
MHEPTTMPFTLFSVSAIAALVALCSGFIGNLPATIGLAFYSAWLLAVTIFFDSKESQ